MLILSKTNRVNKWTEEPGIKRQQFVGWFMFCTPESSMILPLYPKSLVWGVLESKIFMGKILGRRTRTS